MHRQIDRYIYIDALDVAHAMHVYKMIEGDTRTEGSGEERRGAGKGGGGGEERDTHRA
jgi:hypothetical protein